MMSLGLSWFAIETTNLVQRTYTKRSKKYRGLCKTEIGYDGKCSVEFLENDSRHFKDCCESPIINENVLSISCVWRWWFKIFSWGKYAVFWSCYYSKVDDWLLTDLFHPPRHPIPMCYAVSYSLMLLLMFLKSNMDRLQNPHVLLHRCGLGLANNTCVEAKLCISVHSEES